jgi:hypothetical protein
MLADVRRGVCWKIERGSEWVDGVVTGQLRSRRKVIGEEEADPAFLA